MSERFSPWSVVHLVFDHLSEQGLHPVLGETGDPSVPAAELLAALGIDAGQPAQGDGYLARQVHDDLAELRALYTPVEEDPGRAQRRDDPGRAQRRDDEG